VPDNSEFRLRGINHLALVCSDMERTVDFYSKVLGMPLVKTIELPLGLGQHFFFDVGGGDCLAFFWFPEAPPHAPGVAAPSALPGRGELATAHGSMNHVAFDVAPEQIEEYAARLAAKGIETTQVANHDESEYQVSRHLHPGVYIRSVYFFDPDGILLEFAAWTRSLRPDDVRHSPARADGTVATGGVATGGVATGGAPSRAGVPAS
jgi:catechol 2,3-dioxygenase-like lactoylglutathione lyase family enzyme